MRRRPRIAPAAGAVTPALRRFSQAAAGRAPSRRVSLATAVAALLLCAPARAIVPGRGPLYAGTKQAPVLLGVVSFGGDRCGADRLPSVFTEVARYRDFITAPAPVWAPRATGPVTIAGEARVGGELTCAAPWETPPDTIQVRWLRLGATPKAVSNEATYRPGPADQGRTFACNVTAFSAGGFARAQPATISVQ